MVDTDETVGKILGTRCLKCDKYCLGKYCNEHEHSGYNELMHEHPHHKNCHRAH